jgi:hypothetical protein
MKLSLSLFLLGAAMAAAELPKKAPITRYTGLWTNSPFTTKPPPATSGPEANPLDDYALVGVSPIAGGHRVTLLNRKNPDERITIDSDRKSDFIILSVTRKPGDPLGTVVRLQTNNKQGNVTFDPALLTLKAPPANAQPNPGQSQPGVTGNPGQQNPSLPVQPRQNVNNPNGQTPARQPRVRVVPPPATSNTNRNTPGTGTIQQQSRPVRR